MRKEPTAAEARFWHEVRNQQLDGLKFRRQVPIGPYIADFMCVEHRLIVEIDGGQHAEAAADTERDEFLKSQGYAVLRFWNHDVLINIESVIDTVLHRIKERRG